MDGSFLLIQYTCNNYRRHSCVIFFRQRHLLLTKCGVFLFTNYVLFLFSSHFLWILLVKYFSQNNSIGIFNPTISKFSMYQAHLAILVVATDQRDTAGTMKKNGEPIFPLIHRRKERRKILFIDAYNSY